MSAHTLPFAARLLLAVWTTFAAFACSKSSDERMPHPKRQERVGGTQGLPSAPVTFGLERNTPERAEAARVMAERQVKQEGEMKQLRSMKADLETELWIIDALEPGRMHRTFRVVRNERTSVVCNESNALGDVYDEIVKSAHSVGQTVHFDREEFRSANRGRESCNDGETIAIPPKAAE